MKYLLLILTVVLISSCSGKRFYFGYPPTQSTDTIITIDTVEKDVPVEVQMPKDTVRLLDTIYVESSLKTFVDTLKTMYSESHCGWVNGIMLHELFHLDAVIRDTVWVQTLNETTVITNDKLHPVPYVPGWYKFASWFTIINLLLLFLFFLFRFVR